MRNDHHTIIALNDRPHTGLASRCAQVLTAGLLLAAAACSHDLDAPVPAPLETGVLSASKTDIVLDTEIPAEEAVTFSWTTEKNTLIQYELVFSVEGVTTNVAVPTNSVSKKFTNAELNNVLLDDLGLAIGVAVDMDVTVTAAVTINDKTATSNTITVSVTPAPKGPAYNQLWIVGDATPNGWNINAPNEMVPDASNRYQFKFNEVLNAGEFKIPVATGNWSGDFYMPPTDHPAITSTEVQLIPGGNPDNKWLIEDAGPYKVLLNIDINDPFIRITPFTPYDNIYIVGDATTAGWDLNAPLAMTPEAGDPYLFTWTGTLGAGGFRFLMEVGNAGGPFFAAPKAGADLSTTQVTFTPDGTLDNNFDVTAGEEGTYTITLDQLKETISIEKE